MFLKITRHTGLFLFWGFFQVLIVNQWELLNGWILPQPYIFFILALPFEIPVAALLCLCFGGGLWMDAFSNTPGMNASALLVLGMVRQRVLKGIAPRDGYEFGSTPTIRDLGAGWFVKYVTILAFIHHLWLFTLEYFSWRFTFKIAGTTLLSVALTLVLGLIFQYFYAGSTRRR